ncbi:hypothetical protein [Flavobacterium sp.]|uniref:hypothetical protein n=1 Tax=Flavobacterium sp. TaxID=239 RepID=UPI0039E60C92
MKKWIKSITVLNVTLTIYLLAFIGFLIAFFPMLLLVQDPDGVYLSIFKGFLLVPIGFLIDYWIRMQYENKRTVNLLGSITVMILGLYFWKYCL